MKAELQERLLQIKLRLAAIDAEHEQVMEQMAVLTADSLLVGRKGVDACLSASADDDAVGVSTAGQLAASGTVRVPLTKPRGQSWRPSWLAGSIYRRVAGKGEGAASAPVSEPQQQQQQQQPADGPAAGGADEPDTPGRTSPKMNADV